jgi:hypothetical protein
LLTFHRIRIVANQEFEDPAFAFGQALKHMFAQRCQIKAEGAIQELRGSEGHRRCEYL